jgi:preprotein translocase subunit SecA
LFGRAARQGDPGTVEAIVSLQDELFLRYAKLPSQIYARWCKTASRTQELLFKALVRFAQWNAESQNRRVRMETIKRDRKWLLALGFVGATEK